MGAIDRLYNERAAADFAAVQDARAAARRTPHTALEGVIQAGSFDPNDSTVSVMVGDTYAIPAGGDDTYLAPVRVPLGTTQLGDTYAPVGNERCLLVPTQSGYVAFIVHGQDDAPKSIVAGERIIGHRNASGDIDASITLTNDGAPNDAGGGIAVLGGTRVTITLTGGISVFVDAASATVKIQNSDGTVFSMHDGKVYVGGDNLAAGNAVVTQDLLESRIATVFNAHVHTDPQGGMTGPPTSSMTAQGSSTVFATE